MNQLICSRDRTLSPLSLILGLLFWAGAIYGIVHFGGMMAIATAAATVLLAALFGFIAYVFVKSALIAHLRGNAVEVAENQLPDLFSQLVECCEKLSIHKRPRMFVQNGNGVLNAFATWFLGGRYVVLLSSVVDAMEGNTSGVRFYIGHELGHIARDGNIFLDVLRWPALRLPLLGAAFSRARESSCDLHGLACSDSRENAARSLLALMAGNRRWQSVSLDGLGNQVLQGTGFWMSFHELTTSYPWTAKRVVRVLDDTPAIPGRNPLAIVLAAFVPYSGRLASGIGVLIYIYVIGILAAVTIPAYRDYTVKAQLSGAIEASSPAREALAAYYLANKRIPENLTVVGIENHAGDFSLSVEPKGMVLTAKSANGALLFIPSMEEGEIVWKCTNGANTKPSQVPPQCE